MTTPRIQIIGVFALLLVALVLPGKARAADTISFGDRGTTATFGANAIVEIDGTISYASNCPEPGINDFFYPATDVYLVPEGAGTGELHDVGGGRPNTIVSGASFFVGEVIAVTAPGGHLDEGTYDVVYDTCQNGQFDPGWDTVFPGAVTVELPELLPIADGPIRALKDEAHDEYVSWLVTRHAMNGIFRLADRALRAQCSAGNPVGCAMRRVDYFDGIRERFLGLLLSQGNHYLAIAEDPPDPDFDAWTTVAEIGVPKDHSDSALGTATADALRPLAGEAAVNAALLRAIERYQGAQAAGDGEWALVHARQVVNLTSTLRSIVLASGDALDDLKGSVSGSASQLDAELTRGREFVLRVKASGLNADERRALRNQGRTAGQIAELESELRGFVDSATVDSATVLSALDQARAAHDATAAALADGSSAWGEIVAALEDNSSVPDAGPAIDAGGPYFGGEGATLTLHGSAASSVDSAAWDLDGDGSFDDADGLEPSVSFPESGDYVVGLRATAQGHQAVSYAVARITDTNRAPVLSSPLPAERSAKVVIGDPEDFSITATDPDGDPLSYAWTIDGVDIDETSPELTFSPTGDDVGAHVIEVVATDGTAGGRTRRSWEVGVLAQDGDGDGWTATTDCDDADPAVHPTANELLGNEIDDDCDSATPDAPPGGLTGSMWSWGSNRNGALGIGWGVPGSKESPVPIPGYDDDVTAVDAGYSTGFSVLANGQARSWGFNGSGELGDGSYYSQLAPVSPLPVGGGSGQLAGVTQTASTSAHVVARRVDGSVITWGQNRSRQGGDGSTIDDHLFPVQVQTATDGPPLTGVRAVEAGYQENYALMQDGSVRAWGQIRCDGGDSIRIEPFPVPLDLVDGEVRQVSSGNQWTLILKKDGSVLSCGAVPPVAGRPIAPGELYVPRPVAGLGAGSGVIDVSAGYEGGLALKDDGTVWAWGYNGNGSLSVVGVPGGGSAPAPLQVPLPPGPPVVDIDMNGACHALAARADGSVLGWGCDFFEQVGNGPGPAEQVVSEPAVVNLPGASAVSVSASVWHSMALTRPAADESWERPATWVEASVSDATVGEGDGGRFGLSLSAALPHDVQIDWSILPGTAGATDVAVADGTATVPAGARTVEVDVPVLDDTLDEDAESFTIVLREASHGIGIARSQATGTIDDDDEPPTVAVESASIAEGNTTLTDATLPVHLSAPSGKPVAVAFETADGSAVSPADYESASGRLVFAPGQQQAVLHVAVRGDRLAEPSESFSISLSAPENATLGTGSSATMTIADDEPLTLEVEGPTVTEGDGTTSASFTVRLEPAPPTGTSVSVEYELAGVTATVPGDVAPTAGMLEFGPGEDEKHVVVDVQGDDTPEPDEAFRLVLTNPVAAGGRPVLRGENAVAVIVDDDGDSDPDAPVTTAAADPPPNAAGWNRETVTVTLTATDGGGSGVQDVHYRLTGAQTGEATVVGSEATVQVSAQGATTVAYFARDTSGNVETEKTIVVRVDRSAPTLTCSAGPIVLWPPNHGLVPITVGVAVEDGLSGSSGFELASVVSNEPDDAPGGGDGHTVNDIQGFSTGTSDTAGLLRAERAGSGSGRVYTLTYVGTDSALNQRTCTTTVTVPHNH